jgi:NTP pyrophosphatase (non-canonical NTP hydrolase)
MSDIGEITDKLIEFRNDRDWKKSEEADEQKIKEELADVFAFAFLLAKKHNVNVKEILLDKMKSNAEKYSIDKSKGTAKKYSDL